MKRLAALLTLALMSTLAVADPYCLPPPWTPPVATFTADTIVRSIGPPPWDDIEVNISTTPITTSGPTTVRLQYDPTVLEAISVKLKAWAHQWTYTALYNVPGQISVSFGSNWTHTGSGPMLGISFRVLKAGASTMHLVVPYTSMATPGGVPPYRDNVCVQDGSVTINNIKVPFEGEPE